VSANASLDSQEMQLEDWSLSFVCMYAHPCSSDVLERKFINDSTHPVSTRHSHHNTVGSRYSDQRTKIELTTALTKDGFAIQNYRPFRDGPCGITQYMAPSTVKIDMNVGQGGVRQILELYASPSRPGFCIHVGRMVIVKGSDGNMPSFLKLFTLPMPKWLNHVLAASFLK
jgi:hypothetical protein